MIQHPDQVIWQEVVIDFLHIRLSLLVHPLSEHLVGFFILGQIHKFLETNSPRVIDISELKEHFCLFVCQFQPIGFQHPD